MADYILGALGFGHPVILGTPTSAVIGLMIADIWKTTPFVAIIVLAGLVMLPGDVYEAAEVDGASGWYTFWHITLPLFARESTAFRFPAILMSALLVVLVFRFARAWGTCHEKGSHHGHHRSGWQLSRRLAAEAGL